MLVNVLIALGWSARAAAAVVAAAAAGPYLNNLQAMVNSLNIGSATQRILQYFDLRNYIREIIAGYKDELAAMAEKYNYAEVEYSSFVAIKNNVEELIQAGSYPTFSNYSAALEYASAISQAYSNGFLEYQDAEVALAWGISEYVRLGGPHIGYPYLSRPEQLTLDDQLPTFDSIEVLSYWYNFYSAAYTAGTLDYDAYSSIYAHYSAEYDRLVAPVTEAPPGVVIQEGAVVVNVTPTVEAVLPAGAVVINNAAPVITVPAIDLSGFTSATTDVLAAIAAADLAAKDDIGKRLEEALAALSAAQAAATSQAGAQVAAGSQAAAGTQAAATEASGVAVAAAVGTLALAGATEFAKIAKKWGHDVKVGERTCWASTAADLFAQIAGAAVPLTLAIAGEKFNPIREAQNALMERVFAEIWNAPELRSPITPDGAVGVATALFRKAFQLGQLAHLLSVLAETVTPLKTLGLGQVAAFLADMAGFAKIGGAMMGAIESQGLARPFGFYINSKTLTNRPNLGQLTALASEYAISREEFIEESAYQGFSRPWAEKLYELADRALQPRILTQIAEAGIGDDALWDRELHNAGVNAETIPVLKEWIRLAALGELRPTGQAVAVTRYKEGITSEDQLRTELDSLGFRGPKLSAALQQARLARDTDLTLERITLLVNDYLAEALTEGQLTARLTDLELDPERVKVIHDRAVQRYRPPRLPDRLPRLKEQFANTLLTSFERGYTTIEAAQAEIMTMGYTEAEALLAVRNSAAIAYQSSNAEKIDILEGQLTDREITLDQMRVQLLALGITTGRVNRIMELNRLRIQPTPNPPAPEEIPQLSTSQLLAAFRAGTITEIVLRAALSERKYQPADIEVMVATEKAKEPVPAPSKVKIVSETQLRAFFASQLISVEDYYAELIRRGYADLDARRIIELEALKLEAHAKP